jgi:hypothetical protein
MPLVKIGAIRVWNLYASVSICGQNPVFKIKKSSPNLRKTLKVNKGNLRVFLPKKFRIFCGHFYGKSLANPQKIPQKTRQICPQNHAIFDVFAQGIKKPKWPRYRPRLAPRLVFDYEDPSSLPPSHCFGAPSCFDAANGRITALQLNPLPFLGGFFDGGEDTLVFQSVFKGGMDGFALDAGVDEIGNGVDEGMLVADAMAGRPPVGHVGLHAVAFGHKNFAEAAAVFGIVGVIKFQLVHVFKIKVKRAFLAVDFDFNMVFAAGGVFGGFKVGEHFIFHPAEENGGVRDIHAAHFADALRPGKGAFGDKGMDEAADFLELADEIAGEVNEMGVDVAMDAAAAGGSAQAPVLGKIGVGQTFLGVARAKMEEPPERAFGEHPFSEGDGRDATVVVANHVDGFGFLGGGEHLLALLQMQAEGFFAEDVLAVFQGGDGDFRMGIGGRGDVHDINEGRFNNLVPIGGGVLPAELEAGGVDVGGVAAADSVKLDVGFEREEFWGLPPGVGMRPAHEAVTNQSHAKCFRHKKLRLKWIRTSL